MLITMLFLLGVGAGGVLNGEGCLPHTPGSETEYDTSSIFFKEQSKSLEMSGFKTG